MFGRDCFIGGQKGNEVVKQGMEMSMISSLLGHSSSLVTEKVYAEFRQEVKTEAVAKLNFDF